MKPVKEFGPTEAPVGHYAEKMTPIGEIKWRQRAHIQGQVTAIKGAPSGSAPLLQVEVWD